MNDYIQVKIPLKLYKSCEDIVNQTEDLKNPSEVVCYVLKQFAPGGEKAAYTNDEEKEIKKRLKDLGYIG